MICAHCGMPVLEGTKFCGDCGSPVPWQCRACGKENPAEKRFCSDCGVAAADGPPTSRHLSAGAPAATTAERRQLTVMFVDLVGSTALGTRFDPEDLREVIAAFHGAVTGLAAKFEGFVARYMGDGVLVYFGYPHAHENDPERAISAGLEMVSSVGRLGTVAGPPGTLSARVGIASGLVVVGDLIGFGSSLESAAVGDTPNLAARLQTVAEPGTVVISDATKQLAGGLFDYRKVNLGTLKGRAAGETAWAVSGKSAIDSRFEALRPGQLPLVGRAEELELLLRRWEQAKTGKGRVVLVGGDSGIGKSRLVAELERNVRDTTVIRLRLFCSPLYHHTPLYPVIRQIERVARFQRGDSPAAKRSKLRRSLPRDASAEDVSLLADLLAIPGAVDHTLNSVSPLHKKEMTLSAILRQFGSLASQSPVLTILEDVHWADPTTLDLLVRLIELAEHLPLLLVITSRLDVYPVWSSRPNVTVCLLNGFDRGMATSLVKEVAGNQNLPKDVIDRIIMHADGVPLYIEELTKTVLERGLLQKGREPSSPAELLMPDVVPTSLHASLMARLDRLPAGKEVAQTGSVIGRDFSFDTLVALSQVPAKQIEHALDELIDAGLVIARGNPPDATYTFKHALVQDAAYSSLLRERRSSIHQRVAEMLEKNSVNAETAHPQLIAWHFAEAGLPERSVDYYVRAADQATGRFALAEMVGHLRNALRELQRLPDSPERLSRELLLQVALGRALIDHQGSGSEEVRTTFEHAYKSCLKLNNTEQFVRVHDGLINYHFTHSEWEEILRYANELLEVSQKSDSQQALIIARRSGGFAHLLSGHFVEARDELQLFLQMYNVERDGPHAALTTRDPKVSVCTMLGICLTAMGQPDAGAAVSLEGVKHAEEINHVVSLVLGLRRACVQRMMQRDPQGVFDFANRLFKITSEYETFKGARDGAIFYNWARLHTHHDPALLDDIQKRLEHFDATKHWAMLPYFMAATAELMGNGGDTVGAATLLQRAAELARTTGEQWCSAEIMRLQARFGTRDPEEAVRLLQASLAKAKAQGAKLWELRTATSLAEMWCKQGAAAAARDVLAPVLNWFTEGANTADLIAARELLDQLGEPGDVLRATARS